MERSNNDNAVEEDRQPSSKADAAQKGVQKDSSPIKIKSISVELDFLKPKKGAEKCRHFSIRGYVSKVREIDINKCRPFDLSDTNSKDCDGGDGGLPPLEERIFRYWRCEDCMAETDPVEVVIHPAVPLRRSSRTLQFKSVPSPIPTVDASPLILSQKPPSKHANIEGGKDRAKYILDNSKHGSLSTDKRGDKTNICSSSTAGKNLESEYSLHLEVLDLAKLCSNTMHITCPAEDNNHEVADADPRRNLDCVSKNPVGACEIGKENSSHEQTSEGIAHVESGVSEKLTDACASKKGHANAHDTLEADDRSFASSESAEIVVKNSLQGSGVDRPSGIRRKKTKKIRLMTELLSEANGVGKADAPKTADPPSVVIIPDASPGVDKPPGSPSRVVIEGSDRRSLLPNKKRKVPQEDDWSTPDMNAYSRVSKEARTSKKAVDVTKINAAASPSAPVTEVRDKMVLQSSTTKGNSSKNRSENSAGKGKKIVNTESVVTSSELVADVKYKSSTKNKSSKTRGDNSAAVGKKKERNVLVADEHLSLAPPSSENLQTVTASSVGDASKANATDHAVPKPSKNRYAGKEIDLFPLPTQKFDEISTSAKRKQQLKSGQVGDLRGCQVQSNLSLLGEDLATREAEKRKQTWLVNGPANPPEDLSSERELNLSLDIHHATHKLERPLNCVKDRQSSILGGHAGSSKDRIMSENEQERYPGRLYSTHRSPMLAPCGGVQSDSSRKQPILGLPFLRSTQNYKSPTDMGGFLSQKMDFGSKSTHENTTGFQEHRAAKMKDLDQRSVRASEQGASDEVPMDIVELMAKNQYERCLPDAQAERYRSEASSSSSRGQTMDFGKVYSRHLNMPPFYQEPYNEKLQTNDGRNGIIQWGENVRVAKQKSVAKFPQADQNRFFIYQPEQGRSHGSHGEFLQHQKPPSMLKNSSSSSGGPLGEPSWRLAVEASKMRKPPASSHPTGPWNAYQNIPQQNKDAYTSWRNSVPSHHLPFMHNVPQKNAPPSTRMDSLLPSSASIPKASINRDSELNYPSQNFASLQRQSNRLDFQMPSIARLENQFSRKHHNVVEVNQKAKGIRDPRSEDTMSAMHLLSLMDAGARSNVQVSQDGEPQLLRRPSISLEQHSGIGSTSRNDNGQTRTLPYGHVGTNQFARGGVHAPTIGSSSTSFQLDRSFNKAINFSSQVPQASASTSSSFKIPSASSPVHPNQTMLLGSSDSYRIPLQIPTPKPPSKEHILEASKSRAIDGSSKRKLEPEMCTLNRNPADFSYPGPENPYMIGAEDLKFLDADGVKRKRQKKSVGATRGRGRPPRLNPQTC
ncbi:Protein EMBRYONIC FLOWER 1 [Linum perenne]